jgi:hypothetical protein
MGSNSFPELIDSLARFLECCDKNNVHLNGPKCIIGATSIPHLGRICSKQGISVDPARLDPIRQATAPTSRTMLRSFIGLTNWFSDFVPHMASLVAPLLPLTHQGAKWEWTEEHQSAFEVIKRAIVSANPLAPRDLNAPVDIQTDVSLVGLAGVLWQIDENDTWHALSFFSRTLTPAEKALLHQ